MNLQVKCWNILKTYTTKGKFSKELFNLNNPYVKMRANEHLSMNFESKQK